MLNLDNNLIQSESLQTQKVWLSTEVHVRGHDFLSGISRSDLIKRQVLNPNDWFREQPSLTLASLWFALWHNLSSFYLLTLMDSKPGSFFRCPRQGNIPQVSLITYHLVFMALVSITTLLIAHWLKDEAFPQQYALCKWNYHPPRRQGWRKWKVCPDRQDKRREGSADEGQWSWLDLASQKSSKWVTIRLHCAHWEECITWNIWQCWHPQYYNFFST